MADTMPRLVGRIKGPLVLSLARRTLVRYSGGCAADRRACRDSALGCHAPESQTYAVPRDELMELIAEVIEARQLLERLGGDLRAVAARARRST
jgi:hypothetical protein